MECHELQKTTTLIGPWEKRNMHLPIDKLNPEPCLEAEEHQGLTTAALMLKGIF